MKNLSTRLAHNPITRRILGRSNSVHSSQEALLPRQPIDDDETDAASPRQRFSQSSTFYTREWRLSQSSTLYARESPALTGATLVVPSSAEGVSSEDLFTAAPAQQTALRAECHVQSQQSGRELQIQLAHPASEEHSDAIMPAPPRRTESELSQALTAIMPHDSEGRPTLCSICGGVFGEETKKAREKLAYLPCGHAFGDKCLFRYMSQPFGAARCPNPPCIPIRHMCEHMALPTATPANQTFNDSSAMVLPWNYEFCLSPKGLKFVRSIDELGSKVRKLESQKRNRRKSAMDFAFNSRLRYYTSSLEQVEKRLDEAQRIFWTSRWDEFRLAVKKPQRGWSWQRVRGLSRDDTANPADK
ncbi:hypothetical protein E4U42_005230 [Claviceps africana]|uniref:RING-type domain-containing protein n=1 Tax=Claviceps africana TaxID=83212 RepID=A0A8K0NGG1_9HYPO|nr:hypothetical protein E4U42_005230 [Claviceps africana]